MSRTFLTLGGVFLLIAVLLGAFGAHGLEEKLSVDQIDTFNVGVRYQFYHAFGLLICGVLLQINQQLALKWVGWCFAIGIVLFSGSIYLLACRDLLGIASWSWIGPITPIGGTFFIIGWALFIWRIQKL
ncbi:MAG: DUF423 domain-containing protein [Bacteroidota bacterium]